MTTTLPPQGSPEPDEKLPGEAELAALYRQLPQSEPSPALDAAVLRAAARALDAEGSAPATERRKAPRERGDWVHPKPATAAGGSHARPAGVLRSMRSRWLLALSSAATVVLAAGLAWRTRQLPTPPPSSVAAPGALDSAARTTAPATAKPSAMVAKSAPAASLAPGQPGAAIGAIAPTADAAGNAVPARREASPAPATGKAAAPMADASMTVASERAPAADRAADMGAQSRPRAMPPVSPAPLPQVQPAEGLATPAAAPPAPEPMTSSAPAMQAAAPATNAADSGAAARHELEQIRQLFAAHRDNEAQRRLEAFQRDHPQWPLDAELEAHLRKP